MNHQKIINQTRYWIKSVIVEFNFCPFAKRELEREHIRFCVNEHTDIELMLKQVFSECFYLDSHADVETTLIVFPNAVADFEQYLTLLDLAEQLLFDQGYDGVYQLASFHPLYRFALSDADDAANYTNRSPYPMLHLLREASLEKVLLKYPDPENIPVRNIDVAREAGLDEMKTRLDACYKVVDSKEDNDK